MRCFRPACRDQNVAHEPLPDRPFHDPDGISDGRRHNARQIPDEKWEERQAAFSELSDFAQENYSGLAVIKAFVKETKELMMFRRLNRENEDINVEYTKISTLLNIMVTLFVESVICVILGYGGYLVYCGSFDAGQLVEYIGYFSAIVWPIMAVSMLIEKTSRGKASLNRITELLDAKVDVKDRGGVQDLPFIHGKSSSAI